MSEQSVSRKRRQRLSIELKMEIIECYDNNTKTRDIARATGLNESTLRTIRDNAKKINQSVIDATVDVRACRKNLGPKEFLEMEGRLCAWIDEQSRKGFEMTRKIIRNKALSIYEDLKKKAALPGKVKEFKASLGWYQKFEKRYEHWFVHLKSATDQQQWELEENLDLVVENGENSDPKEEKGNTDAVDCAESAKEELSVNVELLAVNDVRSAVENKQNRAGPMIVEEQTSDRSSSNEANCVELSKDKWLCPLSEKKFKGPEFIRKHLTTKRGEKLDQVAYFNNYLADPKRPQNLEVEAAPSAQTAPPREERRERERDYGGDDRGRSGADVGGGCGSSSYGDLDRRGGYKRGGDGSDSGRYGSSYSDRSCDRGGMSRYWEPSGSGRYGNSYSGGSYDRGGTSRYWEPSRSGRYGSSYSGRSYDRGGTSRYWEPSGSGRYGTSYNGRSYDRGGTSRYWEASGSGRRGPREPFTYKDLDAPEDIY